MDRHFDRRLRRGQPEGLPYSGWPGVGHPFGVAVVLEEWAAVEHESESADGDGLLWAAIGVAASVFAEGVSGCQYFALDYVAPSRLRC